MVSVIVPMHNREKYIRKCILSVIDQTYTDWELIVVDDHSEDRSLKRAQYLAADDERITIMQLEDEYGVSCARNIGLDNAKGDYIFFLDSDDYLSRYCLEVLMTNMIVKDSDIVIGGYVIEDEEGDYIKESPNYKTIYDMYGELTGKVLLKHYNQKSFGPFSSCGRLMDRKVIGDTRFPLGVSMSEDRIFMTQIYAKDPRITYDECKQYHFLIHPDIMHGGIYNELTEFHEIPAYEEAAALYDSLVEDKASQAEAHELLFNCKLRVLRRIARIEDMYEREKCLKQEARRIKNSCKRDAKLIKSYGSRADRVNLGFVLISPKIYIWHYYAVRKFLHKA